ncbi:uncharacterized protein PAC_19743 [Phialocephala subalpina]|uniref:Uncharacterized protein n=1 Tax=Phialocephala subalpina TaxID=576137 RepID=A0A1L7XXP6_9HELO|nr:uncharacterized protein PAC_19743 [Phialocephala subalpina]
MYRRILDDEEYSRCPARRERQQTCHETHMDRISPPSPGPIVYFLSTAPLYKTRATVVIENPSGMQESILLPRGTVVKVYLKESPCKLLVDQGGQLRFGWQVNRAELEDEPVQPSAEALGDARTEATVSVPHAIEANTHPETGAIKMGILMELQGADGLTTKAFEPCVVEERQKHWREA